MRRIIFFVFIYLFLFKGTLYAQTQIKAEVDKTSIFQDQTLTYKLTITSSERQLPQPQVPKFEDFKILSQTQSSKVLLRENKLKTILVYTYILAPKEIGKLKIPSAVIKIKNTKLSSEAFEIEVKPPQKKTLQEEKPALPEVPSQETQENIQITL